MKPAFELLPEWNPQRAILINWPHRHSHCWDNVREAVNATYLTIVRTLAMTQSVMIICYDVGQRHQIQRWLIEANVNMPRVRFFIIPSDDVWTRDYGPLTLRHQDQTRIAHFKFNGWGHRHPAQLDSEVTAALHGQNFFPQAEWRPVDFVLEGGSIEVDGKGNLLTTRTCLLSKNRNPDYSQQQIETLLKEHLGARQIFWLENGVLDGDETDGHIDTLARFINPEMICYSQCQDSLDPQFYGLNEMEKQLGHFKTQNRTYQLVPLPLPEPIHSTHHGKRLPATYTKFLITNQWVLMPFYEDRQDLAAQSILQSCFPDREVIGIPCRSLLENFGSLHGITMQIPV
jgi:agmatine deiminase